MSCVVATACGVLISMLGGLPGDAHEVPVQLTATYLLPKHRAYAPMVLTGAGRVQYYLSGQSLRVRAEDLIPLQGEVPVDLKNEARPSARQRAAAGTIITVQWAKGHDVTINGLQLRFAITRAAATSAYTTVALPSLRLTTGSIRVADTSYHGALNLKAREARFVGTITMPRTGKKSIDAQIQGTPIVVQWAIQLL